MYSIPELWALAALELEDGRLEAARALYEEAVAAGEEIGSTMDLWDSWGSLGWVLLLQGELNGAVQLCRKSLITCRRVGRRGGAAFAIFKLGCCAARLGDCLLAAQLIGAHDTFEARINDVVPEKAYKWSPLALIMRNDSLAWLRHLLGEVEFEQAYALGRALSFDEAADLALSKVFPTEAPVGPPGRESHTRGEQVGDKMPALQQDLTHNDSPKGYNPAAGHQARVACRKLRRGDVPDMEDIERLVAHLRDPCKPSVWLIAFTGLRPSELCGLKWAASTSSAVSSVCPKPSYRCTVFGGSRYALVNGPPRTDAGDRDVRIPAWLCDHLAAMPAERSAGNPRSHDRGD